MLRCYIRRMNNIEQLITEVLADRQLLNHPFYQRWEKGELSRSELTSYAEQYRYFETMLPQFLEALLATNLPHTVSALIADNLRDETASPSHLELFEAFAAHYEADEVEISPAMSRLVTAYTDVLAAGTTTALAGLLAYEHQGAAIADSKSAGLTARYGATADAVRFWDEHGSIEGDHARWTMEALESLSPRREDVVAGLNTVGQAWWEFLDERELLAA